MSCYQGSRLIRPVFLFTILLSLLISIAAQAQEKPLLVQGNSSQLIGGPIDGSAKSNCDSTLVMGPWGSGAPFNGQFEASSSSIAVPSWNGWTSRDNTAPPFEYWHVDTYNAENLNGHGPGNLAAWCGSSSFEACGVDDVDGGYGHNLVESLIWETAVGNSAQPAVVTFDAWVNYDVETNYDFVYLGCILNGNVDQVVLVELNGSGENIHLHETFTYEPGDYVGDLENLVRFEILVTSDGSWSDEDCQYPTNGAIQIDDITMSVDNGSVSYFEDFESGDLGQWEAIVNNGVGDFASLRSGLEDIDDCSTNYSVQANFIDDGIVVPGTGGSYCIDWCYGQGGYVVNSTGGLLGDSYQLDNSLLSPVMPWPENCASGGLLEYDVYEHETLSNDSPGVFSKWEIRSTTSADPANIASALWVSNNFVFFSEGYRRASLNVSQFLEPGTTFIQVRLSVVQLVNMGWMTGENATPAPYYDNIRITAYDLGGPAMSTGEQTLANDGFPDKGVLDSLDPGNNSVRFDMALNTAHVNMTEVVPGDSVVIEVRPRRLDAILVEPPTMHYRVKSNALFDPYRTTGLPLEGTVAGNNVVLYGGSFSETRFSYDLPDTGFLFPGDIMHYYFTATDGVSGMDFETSILPADTLGFSDFDDALSYNQSFVFRALPMIYGMDGENFDTASILLWDDLGRDSRRPYWHMALKQALGLVGPDYDVFYTNAPTSGMDNGLGDRASVEQLAGYSVIIYASGDVVWPSISQIHNVSDYPANVNLLDGWLKLGQKNLLLSGDNIASGLKFSLPEFQNFLGGWMGVSCLGSNIRPYIQNQTTPLVQTMQGNPVYFQQESWMAYGGCPDINTFDVVEATNGGVQLAEFLDVGGSGNTFPYAAATLKEVAEFSSKVISLPYDLSYVWDDQSASKASGSLSARAAIIRKALDYFLVWPGPPVAAPDVVAFSTANYPNPFNPQTRIAFNMPQSGHLKIQIFNVRGEKVRTLVDGVKMAGPGSVMWDGTDARGSTVSAGVYFYEARTDSDVNVGKMALVK
jgi:hypothetical protein